MKLAALFLLAVPACATPAAPPTATPTRLVVVDSVDQSRVSLVGIDVDRRDELEMAINRGVVAVSYDAGKLRVLRNCHIGEEQYRYEASALSETVSKPDASTKLLVALRGAKTTTTSRVVRAQLQGPSPDACQGATHFVNRVELGAYTLTRESNPSPQHLIQDGSLDACRADTPRADPLPNCRTPIAVHLLPITER